MAEEIASFKQYKIDKILEAELLSEADDPLTCDLAIALAQLDISNTQYDTSKSLDENKAVIDGIMDTLKQRLDSLRDPEPEPDPEPVIPGDVCVPPFPIPAGVIPTPSPPTEPPP